MSEYCKNCATLADELAAIGAEISPEEWAKFDRALGGIRNRNFGAELDDPEFLGKRIGELKEEIKARDEMIERLAGRRVARGEK
jgi:hypothetical protein